MEKTKKVSAYKAMEKDLLAIQHKLQKMKSKDEKPGHQKLETYVNQSVIQVKNINKI